MRKEALHIHLQALQKKLQHAEYHAAQGKEIVEQQRKRAEKLRSVSGPDTGPTLNADTLFRVL